MGDQPLVKKISWEDPPRARRDMNDWPSLARKLRTRPGQWAKVWDDGPISVVNAIRQGGIVALAPEKGFQARTRNNHVNEDGSRSCTLYLRYVPNEDDPAEPDEEQPSE